MSLFGTSPDTLPSRPRVSDLFGDEPRSSSNQSPSLFADDLGDASDSPWAFPTPKKAARSALVKSLLPASDVPESYIDTYDALIAEGFRVGAGVSLSGVKKLLGESGLGADTQARILDMVVPGREGETTVGVERGEFNVLMALVGLAGEGEDVTLDGVDERRRNLPEPSIPVSKQAKQQDRVSTPQPSSFPEATPPTPQTRPPMAPSQPRPGARKESFGFDADPWASAAPQRVAEPPPPSFTPPQTNGISANSLPRATGGFTTASEQQESNAASNHMAPRAALGGDGAGWGYNGPVGDSGFGTSGVGGEGAFGGSSGAGGGDDSTGLGHSLGGGRVAGTGVEEVITVTSIPEKEGMFLFQHRNYQVTSARRNSKVIRRYSDFVWLLDCLHKRYPFRQLPLLPPKRVAINGNYLAADASFVEKRRRGLARFANALVRHPVLSQEQLVVMFLTVPTELAVWRKQASITVQEEFVGRVLSPALEDSLPPNLQEMFDIVRTGVKRSAEIYINLCNLAERLIKRNEGVAADYLRFSLALQALTDVSKDTYAVDTNDVPLLNEGLTSAAKHLSASQSLLEDEARAWDEGVLEDLKRQRDCLVSMRDLFDRRDRLARDNIPQLEKRITNNEQKLANVRAKPEAQRRPGEEERVEEAIIRDKQSIVNQHARGVFIKECVRDELLFFQQSQYHVSKLHQDWSQERVKYAELQADNWRGFSEEVEGMPLGD